MGWYRVLHPDFWHAQSPEEPDLGEGNPLCTWQGVEHDDFYHPFQCKPFYDSTMYFRWKKHEGLSSFPDGDCTQQRIYLLMDPLAPLQ